jgi:hypothetical protein
MEKQRDRRMITELSLVILKLAIKSTIGGAGGDGLIYIINIGYWSAF